ncbi:atlastin-2-like isoform X2 [Convolutriloba macropyga]|uniref:atlastin-2-like isoform X2 n=1 Tax=Convolutriloba macropyga TaxID=536237 RepID=UPI003F52401C
MEKDVPLLSRMKLTLIANGLSGAIFKFEALKLDFEKGFEWSHGDKRTTDGVVIWSKPFLVRTKSEEVAVILMDTQGSFDNTQTTNDCAIIFALATLVSSCQVYNIVNTIREDDISNLLYFTQYGKMAQEDDSHMEKQQQKPFQRLLFLVRDWKSPMNHPYGHEGGKQKLTEALKVTPQSNQEVIYSRERLNKYFQDIECFLMPHPGLKVATGDQYTGEMEQIETNFMENLQKLMRILLDDDHLKPKQIAGKDITCGELYTCIDSYMKVIKSGKLPTLRNCFLATAEATHLNALSEAVDYYHKSMQNVCGGSKPYVNETMLDRVHDQVTVAADNQFVATKRVGGSIFEKEYRMKLAAKVKIAGKEYREANKSKKLNSAISTPIKLVVLIAFSALIWTIFSIAHITIAESVVKIVIWILTVMLAVWWTLSLVGLFHIIKTTIDKLVAILWKLTFSIIVKKLIQKMH